jgi:hypothetical protein
MSTIIGKFLELLTSIVNFFSKRQNNTEYTTGEKNKKVQKEKDKARKQIKKISKPKNLNEIRKRVAK